MVGEIWAGGGEGLNIMKCVNYFCLQLEFMNSHNVHYSQKTLLPRPCARLNPEKNMTEAMSMVQKLCSQVFKVLMMTIFTCKHSTGVAQK